MAHTPQSRAKYLAKVLQRRQQWLQENGPCRRCQSWHDLQVHHREQDQKTTHRIWTFSAARRAKELATCEPLCKACHVTIHSLLARKPHGMGGYRRGCRCEICRAAIAPQIEQKRLKRDAARALRGLAPGQRSKVEGGYSFRDQWAVVDEDEAQR